MLSADHEVLRPTPRRPFEITPASSGSSAPATPYSELSNPNMLDSKVNNHHPPSRTRSILNLTSSTLFGIYSPTVHDTIRDEPSTPWGTGAQTPGGHQSLNTTAATSRAAADWERPGSKRTKSATLVHQSHLSAGMRLLGLALKTVLLFCLGVAYGVIIILLHDNHFRAIRVSGIDGYSWAHLAFWGIAGVVLGSLLPWVDILWEDKLRDAVKSLDTRQTGMKGMDPISSNDNDKAEKSSHRSNDWTPVVRSLDPLTPSPYRIASNIPEKPHNPLPPQRRIPWQSTLQVSLTLALVNPVLWYLVDRSKPGFFLSSLIGIAGTAILLRVNPEIVPPPATVSMPASVLNASSGPRFGNDGIPWLEIAGLGGVSRESIGVGTWIASVLFCGCVCIGNIGRRLGKQR
ncbi:MAG: hypothetical protein M1835_004433 [Candelina submexicana]|nr:MAG: hypothetical protein M1835_004433 [Candelina submexicana]